MNIGAISGNSSALLQHLQNVRDSAANGAPSSTSPSATSSPVAGYDPDNDGDIDTPGAPDRNDATAPGQFINVQA